MPVSGIKFSLLRKEVANIDLFSGANQYTESNFEKGRGV